MDLQLSEEKRIKHYSSYHKILLVGEGDFSFALSLAKAFGSATNMVATSLDSKGSLVNKYTSASTNLDELERIGCTIVHDVHAREMNEHPLLQDKLFDRIVFNFPHAGFPCKENCNYQIQRHQEVVRGFFNSARNMISQEGEIHITHKTSYPFCNWKIEELAMEACLVLEEKVPFVISDYPGYNNKRGDGSRCDLSFPIGQCSTFKFKEYDIQSILSSLLNFQFDEI